MTTLTAMRPAAQPAAQTEILARILPVTPAPKAANDPLAERPTLLARRRERQRRRDAR